MEVLNNNINMKNSDKIPDVNDQAKARWAIWAGASLIHGCECSQLPRFPITWDYQSIEEFSVPECVQKVVGGPGR